MNSGEEEDLNQMLLLAKVVLCGIQETESCILLGNILTSKYAFCSHIKLASPCVLPHKEWPYLIFPRSCSRRMGCTPLFSEGNCQKLESKRQSQDQIECSLSDQCCRSKEIKNLISDIEKSFIVDLHFSGSDIYLPICIWAADIFLVNCVEAVQMHLV